VRLIQQMNCDDGFAANRTVSSPPPNFNQAIPIRREP